LDMDRKTHRDMRKTWSPVMNQWEKEFGAARRRIDRRLLAELERSIPAVERIAFAPATTSPIPQSALDARERIARAFGRPLA
jgi:hypothetical protein